MTATKDKFWMDENGTHWRREVPESTIYERCGAPAGGGPCVLPSSHNIGRADIPANHVALQTRYPTAIV